MRLAAGVAVAAGWGRRRARAAAAPGEKTGQSDRHGRPPFAGATRTCQHPRVPYAVLRFGVFDLNPATGELHRAGVRIRIQPQPLRVLEILAARSGEIVSREDLRRAVWGDGTFVDFEHGLNFCITQVRRALGDNATSPRFVETVPRHGYRFLAPVERVAPVAAALPAPKPTAIAAPASRFRPGWRFALAALAALLAGGRVEHAPEVPASEVRPAAREAYLKGLYHTQRGPAEWAEGVRCLERAVADDPSFRAAQTALAGGYVQLAQARLRPGREVFPLARSAAIAALRGARESADAHVWLGVARLSGDWDWTGAEREMKEAIALAPDLALARRNYAALLSARGDDDRALAELAQARRIDPLCTTITGEAALIHYRARRYDEAAALWREGLRVRPDSGGHEGLFHLYLQEGDLGGGGGGSAARDGPGRRPRARDPEAGPAHARADRTGLRPRRGRPSRSAGQPRPSRSTGHPPRHPRRSGARPGPARGRGLRAVAPAPGRPSRPRVRLPAGGAAVPKDRGHRGPQ